MRFFDLHCDTLSKLVKNGGNIYKNNFDVSIEKTQKYDQYIGCFAVWISDDMRGKKAFDFFKLCKNRLEKEEDLYSKYFKICKSKEDLARIFYHKKSGVILCCEGSSCLGGDLSNLDFLKESSVKIMTLTWNNSCEAGDGVAVENSRGITFFGKKLLKKLEEYNIIVDVSHASEKLFYDVCDLAEKPIIASHSNCKNICKNKRNLSNEQFKSIVTMGGIVGITFCKDFLSNYDHVNYDDIFRNIEYFLSLSGENTLAIGSDFDGAKMPDNLNDVEYVENLYEYLLKKNYKENLLDKIFFSNAYNFIKKFY